MNFCIEKSNLATQEGELFLKDNTGHYMIEFYSLQNCNLVFRYFKLFFSSVEGAIEFAEKTIKTGEGYKISFL